MTDQPNPLSHAQARKLIALAHDRMAALGAGCAVAIVDAGGVLIAFERGDGMPPLVGLIAEAKAMTSALMGVPTSEVGTMVANWPGIADPVKARLGGRFCCYGGGVPLTHAGVRIGAVAISGGTEAQDEQIALEIAAIVEGSA